MRRAVLLAVVPFVSAFLGASVAFGLLLPRSAQAQRPGVSSERVTVVGDNGAERVILSTGPGVGAGVRVRSPDGATTRVIIQTGAPGEGGTAPGNAGLNINSLDGTRLVNLGTASQALEAGRYVPGTFAGGSNLYLMDEQGRIRITLRAAEGETPFMAVLGEDGSTVWRTP